MAVVPAQLPRARARPLSGAVAFLFAFAAAALQSSAAPPAPTESQVKAAFLLNFTKFTEWPASAFPAASSPLTICVIGGDPFGSFLDTIVQGESLDGRKIAVRRAPTVPDHGLCQLAYLNLPLAETKKAVAALQPGVLTVGEGEKFVDDGGIIGFVLDNNHVRFLVNLSAAQSAGLKLSSRMLSVAKAIGK